MKKSQRSKIIKKFNKKIDLIKFLCDNPSDFEGFELIYVDIKEPAKNTPISGPAIKLIPSQSQPRSKSEGKEKIKKNTNNEAIFQCSEVPKENKSTKPKQQMVIEQAPKNPKHSDITQHNLSILNPQGQILTNDKKKQILIEDTLPKRFSSTLKSDSIQLNQRGTQATVGQNSREGFVLIDFPIKAKVSWQLKVESPSLFASFGICQTKINSTGERSTLQNIIKIDTNSEEEGFFCQNGHIIKITLNPFTKNLIFFNSSTRKTKMLTVLPKKQGSQYYPYIYLYKATVSLEMQYLIDEIKRMKNK